MSDVIRLLEIGIAVHDAKAATENLSQLFRAASSDLIADTENFAMRFTMCRVGDVDFEIMETASASGLIQRFIDHRGEGLHHIAFLVQDAEALLQKLRRQGVPVLSDKPVLMANLKAFFVHPAYFGGILLEFVENLHPWLDGKSFEPQPASPLSAGLLSGSTIKGIVAKVSNIDATMAALKMLGATDCAHAAPSNIPQISCKLGNIALTLIDGTADVPEGHWLAGRNGLRRVDLELDDPASCAQEAGASAAYRVVQQDGLPTSLFSNFFHGTAFGLYPRQHDRQALSATG